LILFDFEVDNVVEDTDVEIEVEEEVINDDGTYNDT